ncbi:MAG: hypothetical protein N3D73_00950 [Candidatus Diapherotrites archaeon]|nr:hypothetical protein [Candidatus Diapherotrites archaeon]
MDKRKEVLLDSISKLIDLGLSKQEIIQSLSDVGVSKEEAESLLNEIQTRKKIKVDQKGLEKEDSSDKKSKEELQKQVASEYSDSEKGDKIDELFFDMEYENLEKGLEKGQEQSVFKKYEDKVSDKSHEKEESYILWERGILSTVDAKLEEMKKIKEDINNIIEQKIKNILDKEMRATNALIESEIETANKRIDATLNRKVNEINVLIDRKIEELKQINLETKDSLKKIEMQKSLNQSLLTEIENKLLQLEKIKETLIRDVNKEIIEAQTKVEDFLKDSLEKREALDNRINRALELESKIVEGLFEDAKNKIDKLELSKSTELESKIDTKLKELEILESKISPEVVEKRLEEIHQEISNDLLELFKTQQKDLESFKLNLLSEFNQKLSEEKSNINDKLSKLENLYVQVSPEAVEKKVQEINNRLSTDLSNLFNAQKSEFIKFEEKIVEEYSRKLKEEQSIFEQKVKDLENLASRLDVKAIDQRFAELQRQQQEELRKARDTAITVFNRELSEEKSKINDKLSKLENLYVQVSPEVVEKRLEEIHQEISNDLLELFKTQQQELTSFKSNLLTKFNKELEDTQYKFKEKIEELNRLASKVSPEIIDARFIESQKKQQQEISAFKENTIKDINQRLLDQQSKIDTKLKELEILESKISPEVVEKRLEEIHQEISNDLLELFKTQQKDLEIFNNKLASNLNLKVKEQKEMLDAYIDDTVKQVGKVREALNAQIPSLVERVDKKINELEVLQSKINPYVIEDKMLAMREEISRDILELFNSKQKELDIYFNNLANKQNATLSQFLAEKEQQIDTALKRISPERVEAALESIDEFKVQFVKVVEKNIAEFNEAKRSIAEDMKKRDEQISQHIAAIDEKMRELTEFEKEFAEEMGIMLDKILQEKKKLKSQEKKK